MTDVLGPVTATFSIVGHPQTSVEDDVRAILAARYLEPSRLRSRRFADLAFIVVEQPRMCEAEAQAVLGELRALGAVRRAELECRIERRQPHPSFSRSLDVDRIDVV